MELARLPDKEQSGNYSSWVMALLCRTEKIHGMVTLWAITGRGLSAWSECDWLPQMKLRAWGHESEGSTLTDCHPGHSRTIWCMKEQINHKEVAVKRLSNTVFLNEMHLKTCRYLVPFGWFISWFYPFCLSKYWEWHCVSEESLSKRCAISKQVVSHV